MISPLFFRHYSRCVCRSVAGSRVQPIRPLHHSLPAAQQSDIMQQAHTAPRFESKDRPEFPGARSPRYTETLEFIDPEQYEGIPVYRVMNRDGVVHIADQDPKISQEKLRRIYKGNLHCLTDSNHLLHDQE